jgi:hypothetical protein
VWAADIAAVAAGGTITVGSTATGWGTAAGSAAASRAAGSGKITADCTSYPAGVAGNSGQCLGIDCSL